MAKKPKVPPPEPEPKVEALCSWCNRELLTGQVCWRIQAGVLCWECHEAEPIDGYFDTIGNDLKGMEEEVP